MKLLPRNLIDQMIDQPVKVELIDNNWYIAKPLEFWGLVKYLTRIRDAYEVLLGRQTSFEFMEDRLNRLKKGI